MRETYYDYRLIARTTLDGVIVDFDLFAAGKDERGMVLDLQAD